MLVVDVLLTPRKAEKLKKLTDEEIDIYSQKQNIFMAL
jgi:hypothetical protein